jgi:hypothetical protein
MGGYARKTSLTMLPHSRRHDTSWREDMFDDFLFAVLIVANANALVGLAAVYFINRSP